MTLTKEDLQAIKGLFDWRFDALDGHMDKLENRVDNIEADIRYIKVDVLENSLIPKVNEIAAYQKSVYERYKNSTDRFDEKITLIDTTAQTVVEHSKQIQALQLKQA